MVDQTEHTERAREIVLNHEEARRAVGPSNAIANTVDAITAALTAVEREANERAARWLETHYYDPGPVNGSPSFRPLGCFRGQEFQREYAAGVRALVKEGE